jgi:hypothetical protein
LTLSRTSHWNPLQAPSAADRRGFVVEGRFMSRRSWKRIIAAVLVVMVCALAVPAKASAAAPTMDSMFHPASWVWIKGMDWLRGFWTSLHAGIGANKMGAGHSSDGHAEAKSAI